MRKCFLLCGFLIFVNMVCNGQNERKYGMINKSGEIVVPLIYSHLYYVTGNPDSFDREDIIDAKKDGKWGLLDRKGNVVVPCEYDGEGFGWTENMASVILDGKCGFVDMETSELVIPCTYINVGMFHDGLAFLQKGERYGYIDKTGKVVIPFLYDHAYDFHEGLAKVHKKGGYGFINTIGELIIPCIYDDADFFQQGFAVVKKKGKLGLINRKGEEVIPCNYKSLRKNPLYDFLIAKNDDGKCGIINKNNEELLPFIYDGGGFGSSVLTEGIAYIKKNKKYGFVDSKGKLITDCIYNGFLQKNKEGFIKVQKDGKYVMINAEGKEIDGNYKFHEGLAKIVKNKKYGFVNTQGEEVVPCIYDYADDFHEGTSIVYIWE